jgi:hypothetical protein
VSIKHAVPHLTSDDLDIIEARTTAQQVGLFALREGVLSPVHCRRPWVLDFIQSRDARFGWDAVAETRIRSAQDENHHGRDQCQKANRDHRKETELDKVYASHHWLFRASLG